MATSLNFPAGQKLLDSLPKDTLMKMQISIKINACSSFWQSHLSIKWPECRNFYIRASSVQEVESRAAEMLYKYLATRSIIDTSSSCSSRLKAQNKNVVNTGQRKDANLILASSDASGVGGANMFKKSISSLWKQEYDGTLIKMMHTLNLKDTNDEKQQQVLNLNNTNSKSKGITGDELVDDPSTKRRKVEIIEGSSGAQGVTSISVTLNTNTTDQNLPSSRKGEKRRKERKTVQSFTVQKPKETLISVTVNTNTTNQNSSSGKREIKKKERKPEESSTIQKLEEVQYPGLEEVETRFPAPRNTLSNLYKNIVSEFGSEDYDLKSKYKMISMTPAKWECTLFLKWPEPKSFSAVKQTKALAAKEASLIALKWLQSLDKITKRGAPILYDPKGIDRYPPVEVALDSNAVEQAEQIVRAYTQTIKPQLDCCDSRMDSLETEHNNEAKTEPNDVEEEGEDTDLFNCGEQRHPITGRYMQEVSEKAINTRNNDLYKRFHRRSRNSKRDALPIMAFRESILEMIENNPVLVIKGEPGCGKSTLVPQFIMEQFESKKQGAYCNIIITQPRRISAISLAEWVAREREEMLGDVIGYQVRLKSALPRSVGGAALFCSTGILLRRLISNPGLFGASHIIVDEAHERDINTDFLLILLRRALKLNPDLRVIVMSATINAELFQNYFHGAAAINVPGFTYPVKSIFMDKFHHYNIPINCTKPQECPTVNVKRVAELVKWVDSNHPIDGAVLCFLPGWAEIKKVQELLENDRMLSVVPVHSKLKYNDQRKIFLPPPCGTRKVILATNIAETSITINDVEYVIDAGMHREYRLDAAKGMPTFGNHWVSQASVNQRRGRAGRVKPGKSFHLYTTEQFEEMEPFPIPEILRMPLEKTVLDCKAYSREEKAAEFLQQMPEPPSFQAVENAVNELMQLGALDAEENLTPLGKRIALFTVHPKLSVALIHAAILRCLNPIVTVAAIFGNEIELFYGAMTDKEIVRSAKKAYHPTSDHLAISWLFQQWETLSEVNASGAQNFCGSRRLLPEQLELVRKLRHIIAEHLQDCSMLEDKGSFADLEAECNVYAGNDELVKGILLSGFGTLLLNQDFDWRNGRLVKQKVLVSDTGNRVALGSESVNYGRGNFMSKFLTHFQEMTLTERRVVMVRETTMVAPLTVFLFLPGEFEVTNISSRNGYVLLKHKRKWKVMLAMKEEEAALFMELRKILWSTIDYFIKKEGIAREDVQRYQSISKFHKKLLQVLSDMMLKAGTAIEYKDGVLIQ